MPFDPIPDPSTLIASVFGIERQLAQLDRQLDAARFTATSSDGAVTAVANGTPRLVSLSITQAALDAANASGSLVALANQVKTVINQALGSAQDASASTTSTLANTLSLQGICAPTGSFPNIAGFAETAAALTAQVPVIDQRIVARTFQWTAGPVTAVINGHFEVVGLTIAGFPTDVTVIIDQTTQAVNGGIDQAGPMVDGTIETTVNNVPRNVVGFGDVCLYARGSLTLADRFKVVTSSGGLAAIANAGNVQTTIGVTTRVGNIWSVAPVTLRNNAHVEGFVKTPQTVTSQTTPPDVSGGVFPATFIQVPNLSLQVTFPGTNNGDVSLEPGTSRSLSPGAYGNVVVKGTLTVRSGTYTFESLDLESQGTLVVDSRSGRVIIHVHGGNLIFRARQTSVSGQANFFLGYYGTNMVVMGAAFTGTLVAPTALVNLNTIAAPGYTGAVFAKDINADPDSTITFVPYSGTPSLGTF
jgi:DNA-binding protein YbaB